MESLRAMARAAAKEARKAQPSLYPTQQNCPSCGFSQLYMGEDNLLHCPSCHWTEGPEMLDGGLCECGGQYEHVDEERDDGGVIDSYQCSQCQTWCLVTWDPETEEEVKRGYSRDA